MGGFILFVFIFCNNKNTIGELYAINTQFWFDSNGLFIIIHLVTKIRGINDAIIITGTIECLMIYKIYVHNMVLSFPGSKY